MFTFRHGMRKYEVRPVGWILAAVVLVGILSGAWMITDRARTCRDPILVDQVKEAFPNADPKVMDIVRAALLREEQGIIHRSRTLKYECDTDQFVVVTGSGKRVTVFVATNAKPEYPNVISFWVRPNGSTDGRQLVTFSDEHFDRTVDFGASGASPGDVANPKFFQRSDGEHGGAIEGLEYRAEWQSVLDATIDEVHDALFPKQAAVLTH